MGFKPSNIVILNSTPRAATMNCVTALMTSHNIVILNSTPRAATMNCVTALLTSHNIVILNNTPRAVKTICPKRLSTIVHTEQQARLQGHSWLLGADGAHRTADQAAGAEGSVACILVARPSTPCSSMQSFTNSVI
jgi:hypothetical protein